MASEGETKTQLTTLRKPDVTQTKDTADKLRHIFEHFTPEYNNNNDDDGYRRARLQSQLPVRTVDDKVFTLVEVRCAIGTWGTKSPKLKWY